MLRGMKGVSTRSLSPIIQNDTALHEMKTIRDQ
jgi:hypothetical protein